MSAQVRLRESVCLLAKSLFDLGLTPGASGNISARTPDGALLVTPTGRSFGRLDPRLLTEAEIADVVARFGVEWEA